MRRLEGVRGLRWFDGRLEIEGEAGPLHAEPVGAGELVVLGFNLRPGLRYLAMRLPGGSAVVLERRGERTALALSVRQAG